MIENFYNIVNKYVRNEDIKVILDLGARDLEQSIEFSKIYGNAIIYAFECSPRQYKICLDKAKDYINIKVCGKAVHDRDGKCDFYQIDVVKHNNCGASSLFKASGKYDYIEPLPQYKINVECTRFDTFCKENGINNIDLIWMDVQGAELLALKGLGNLIDNVKAIYTEVLYQEIYTGQALFGELDKFLSSHGFVLMGTDGEGFSSWWTNGIYINKRLM
jgi:FkbM family methyltransferase